ncbi:hypothetical protein ERO13_D05G021550v2 [Gossypium hirsutum]|uniref:Uncharacterized protein n=1 Tax=Gossypium tomentosum TaxID=34277 RepID=A0A5D2KPJ5_GOSTO|nr:hypothetical protein ERO13_D05G021550v2 [Gossypium hirsutum]TYH68948.1 hypothetical protein ES332_D05G023600v1 [Gossypium tomentosum]
MKKPHSKPPNSLYNSRHPLVSQSSSAKMEKKRVMVQSKDLDFSTVKYEHEVTKAPHLTGLMLKLLVRMVEAPVIGSLIMSSLKKQNKMVDGL